jgi:hypothetical protein
LFKFVHPADQAPAIDFELRFTGTSRTDPTGLLREALAPAAQAWQPISKERQFNLRLSLWGTSVLGEDVQNNGGSVNGCSPEDLLEVALLGGAEVVLKDHSVNVKYQTLLMKFLSFPRSNERGGVCSAAALDDTAHHVGTRRRHQCMKFIERAIKRFDTHAWKDHTDQDDALSKRTIDERLWKVFAHCTLVRGTRRSPRN